MQKFLVVDDHSIIRHGIIKLLQEHYPACLCVEAKNGKECIELFKKQKFDLVILDVNLPNTDALDLTHWMKVMDKEARIIIFTVNANMQQAAKYYRNGAMAYITKDKESEEILKAIDLVWNNRMYMTSEFQHVLPSLLAQPKQSFGIDTLSEREFAVANSLAQGLSYEEIATIMSIEVNTVRSFKSRIFRKLNVKNFYDFLKLFDNS